MNDLLLIARIAGNRCAFRAAEIQSVIDLGKITPIPRAPSYIVGMTALRSQALTVIDCRRLVCANPEDHRSDMRAPVVCVDGHSYALIVDTVEDVVETDSEVTTVAGGFGEEWALISSGMVESTAGPLLVLNVDSLITGPGRYARAA